MIPKEILKNIRRIEIRSRKLVNEIFAGQYSSVFKGRGMEFSEVREYAAGDDVRTIDWNVTARYGKPFVKKFMEERELTVILLVDASASLQFGTRGKFKSELAAEISSVLAFSAIKNNDRVGMIIFTDRVEKVIQPRKGRNHILRLVREILYFRPAAKGTDIGGALRSLNEFWRRKAVVFMISDFQVPHENFDLALKVTAKRHDLTAIKINDPRENTLIAAGLLAAEDPETGQRRVIDTTDEVFQRSYRSDKEKTLERLKNLLLSSGVDQIALSTDAPYVMPLIQFFKKREKRLAV